MCHINFFLDKKHQCPVIDEGFYDGDDSDINVCEDCDENLD